MACSHRWSIRDIAAAIQAPSIARFAHAAASCVRRALGLEIATQSAAERTRCATSAGARAPSNWPRRIAALKAANAGLSLAGSVVASDAFFPFRDGLDVVADNGAIAIIQPGGSMRDAEVIAAADERGIAMVFTGIRHFRH